MSSVCKHGASAKVAHAFQCIPACLVRIESSDLALLEAVGQARTQTRPGLDGRRAEEGGRQTDRVIDSSGLAEHVKDDI